ncbi:MAG: hypothetical protein LJE94_04360 [Deltaproteobacteria bacterium]|jgi:hypothetical protein|nr:hypothetical protein [Deltaproteobacteria bacterium]
MKTRVAFVMVVLMSVALLFGCASSGKLDPNMVRTDDLQFWEDCAWTDMTPAEQDLWKVLGWNEASWEGEAKQPASEDKYWNALTPEEQAAATALGYTKESWDEE